MVCSFENGFGFFSRDLAVAIGIESFQECLAICSIGFVVSPYCFRRQTQQDEDQAFESVSVHENASSLNSRSVFEQLRDQ